MGKSTKTRRKLLLPERENLILSALGNGVHTIAELADALQVSEATVRRDLLSMEEQSLIRRVHGGAVPVQSRTELRFHEKAEQFAAEKEAIAEQSLKLIKDGDSIFLDGGSTVLALVRKLSAKKNLTLITNSLMAASELMESDHRLILLGGEFRPLSRTLVGALTRPLADSIYIDKAFLGTIGFCRDGLYTTDPAEAFTKELIISRADQVILLADSSKFGVKSLVKSGNIEDIDAVITDDGIPAEYKKILDKNQCNVIKATITKGE